MKRKSSERRGVRLMKKFNPKEEAENRIGEAKEDLRKARKSGTGAEVRAAQARLNMAERAKKAIERKYP